MQNATYAIGRYLLSLKILLSNFHKACYTESSLYKVDLNLTFTYPSYGYLERNCYVVFIQAIPSCIYQHNTQPSRTQASHRCVEQDATLDPFS